MSVNAVSKLARIMCVFVSPAVPDIEERFLKCLEICRPANENEILFPISKKTCGTDRDTSLMMMFDLAAALRAWLADAKDDAERETWQASDFLKKFSLFHCQTQVFLVILIMD